MELTRYVEDLRRELFVAAEAGGEEALALAERLTGPLQASARLMLLEALSGAAAEITVELAPGSVELRLRGHDPDFVVQAPPRDDAASDAADDASAAPSNVAPAPDGEDGATSRISFRLPDTLKSRIEAAAGSEGLSVNAWLVRAAAAAAESGAPRDRPGGRRSAHIGDRYTGWVR